MAYFSKGTSNCSHSEPVLAEIEEKSLGLLHIGKHCAEPSCNRMDFLPVTCDKCSKSYCSDHQSYSAHECVYHIEYENVMPKCPLCSEYVKVPRDADVDEYVNSHIASGCKKHLLSLSPEEKARIKASFRCGASGCLNPNKYSTIRCRQCSEQFCLSHRFPTDHACDQRRAVAKPTQEAKKEEKKGALARLLERLRGPKSNPEASSPPASPHTVAGPKPSTNSAVPTSSNSNPSCVPVAQKPSRVSGSKLIKLKASAEGDKSVEATDRITFTVVFPSVDPLGQQLPPQARAPKGVFFNKNWTVGKALDNLCRLTGIQNNNHDPKKPKLILARVDNPVQALPFSCKLSDLGTHQVLDGETIALSWLIPQQ